MANTVADALFERLIEAFPANTAYARADFEQAPMPAPVAHFLTQELRARVGEKAETLVTPSAWFDADHPEVRQAVEKLRTSLIRHARFPAGEWERALRQAVETVTSYHVRPVSTLASFIYRNGAGPMSTRAVERSMSYFSSYRYLHETIRLYFVEKDIRQVDQKRCVELLRQVDRQMTQEFDEDDWVNLLKPLFALLEPVHPDGVPVALLETFFQDKGEDRVVRRLQSARSRHDVVDPMALRRLLETPVEPEPDAPAVEPVERPATPPPSVEQETRPIPLWKQYQQGVRPAPQPVVRPTTSPRNPPHIRPGASSPTSLPLWKRYRRPDAPPNAEGSDGKETTHLNLTEVEQAVLREVGPKHRELFIQHLFAGSAADYERVLRRLYAAPSWAEASRIIGEEIFRKNQVNIYSDPAVLFTDAVESRYA